MAVVPPYPRHPRALRQARPPARAAAQAPAESTEHRSGRSASPPRRGPGLALQHAPCAAPLSPHALRTCPRHPPTRPNSDSTPLRRQTGAAAHRAVSSTANWLAAGLWRPRSAHCAGAPPPSARSHAWPWPSTHARCPRRRHACPQCAQAAAPGAAAAAPIAHIVPGPARRGPVAGPNNYAPPPNFATPLCPPTYDMSDYPEDTALLPDGTDAECECDDPEACEALDGGECGEFLQDECAAAQEGSGDVKSCDGVITVRRPPCPAALRSPLTGHHPDGRTRRNATTATESARGCSTSECGRPSPPALWAPSAAYIPPRMGSTSATGLRRLLICSSALVFCLT